MIKVLFFTTVVFSHCRWQLIHGGSLPASQQAEQTLVTSLLISSSYNKNIRPDGQVVVDITAKIQHIVSVDEKQQILTSSSFISQTWLDQRLSWTPNATNSFTQVIQLPVKSLWIPDTMILNSVDNNPYLPINDYSYASVDYSGQVYMIVPALMIKTRCSMNIQKFPFDKQICSINLTSWSQGSTRIMYTENSSQLIDTTDYNHHPLWKLNGTDMVVLQMSDRSPFEEDSNTVIAIQLYLHRQPLFFIVNGIFACLILNCVTLLSYALPFGTQISLCMVCFMTYSVYSLNFSNLFPQQSEYLMMITLYFLFSICWTLLSMAWFIISNHFITKAEMPKALHIFSEFLQEIFCCCFKPDEKDEKDVTKKPTDDKTVKCVYCRQLFGSCCRKTTNQVEDVKDQKQEFDETPAVSNTDETVKPKCQLCDRCDTCQADFDKDKSKGKKKKDIEAKCSALNYFIFILILLFMFISNMAIWLVMSQ